MNPEQNLQPQQQLDGQPLVEPPVQQPAVNPAQYPSVNTTQTPVQVQTPVYSQQLKQSNKLIPIVIVGVAVLIVAALGAYILLSGDKPANDNQSGANQSTATPQDEIIEQSEKKQSTLPSTKQAQSDTQQKTNVAKLLVAVNEYSANNNGKFPATSDVNSTFIGQYVKGEFEDPSGNVHMIVESDPLANELQYKTTSTCDSDNSIVAGGRRQFAVRVLLSDSTYYCNSN